MAISFTVDPNTLDDYNLSTPAVIKLWQREVAEALSEHQAVLANPEALAGQLSGQGLLGGNVFSLVQVSTTPSANQTIDTKGSALVYLNYAWTTAANFTVTLNNVVDGQILFFRFAQNSGAARTVTLSANAAGGGALGVYTANSALSGGVSVGNGVAVGYVGLASATIGFLIGVGQNW